MKTLAELKQMSFIPHHDCGLCGAMVGWEVLPNSPRPYFNPSCGCGSSEGHYDTWEEVFKWYNTAFEKESEEAVQAAWDNSQLNRLMYRIDNCAEKDCIEFIRQRLESIEHRFFSLANCKPVCEMLKNHKSNWIPNSKGGEPNHR